MNPFPFPLPRPLSLLLLAALLAVPALGACSAPEAASETAPEPAAADEPRRELEPVTEEEPGADAGGPGAEVTGEPPQAEEPEAGEPKAADPASASPAEPPPAEPPAEARRLPTGLVTQVLEPGEGTAKPKARDSVVAHLVAWSDQGTKFQDTYEQGSPAFFDLQKVFPAWRQGLQLMVEGEKRRLWIPAELAPKNPQGPTGAAVFDVELIRILTAEPPPPDLRNPPTDAVAHPRGAKSKVLTAGTGDTRPTDTDGVVLTYTGWSSNGQIFDTTARRGRPAMFPLSKVMPAFAEVMKQMVVGESRRIWIPGAVAQGNWVGGPRGDLVFDVQMHRIVDTRGLIQEGPPPPGAERIQAPAPPG